MTSEGSMPRHATVDAAEFLTSLNHLFSAASLYPKAHPARVEALDESWSNLRSLFEYGAPVFSFLDDAVLYGQLELRDMRSWDFGSRLYESGIQRLEIQAEIQLDELDSFIEHVRSRFTAPDPEPIESAGTAFPHIRIGTLTVRVEPTVDEEGGLPEEPVQLDEELDAVRWIYNEARSAELLPTAEVRLAVESLALTMESLKRSGSGLIAIKSRDQYTAIHCMNVAILSMTFAEQLGFRPDEIRLIGEAAMLHDIGKTTTPDEILNKPGVLTPNERKVIEEHTIAGCRLLLESRQSSPLAATVAYEHHMGNEGRGYPDTIFGREPHPVSRLVQVCDVYDALRTRRPFRPPMDAEESLRFLGKRAGVFFHPALVKTFVEMVQQMEFKTPSVRPQTTVLEQAEREAAAALRAQEGGSLEERLEAMAEGLLAPEPTATVDWLEIL
jgi:putative nucleotidyltransferase with HDIG domain